MSTRFAGCVAVALVVLPTAGAASPIPTPVGSGRGYLLPAATSRVLHAARVAGYACGRGSAARDEAHVELFARGLVLLVPQGIGVGPGCSYPVRTTQPTGVVEFVAAAHPTVGSLFAVWGQPLGPRALAGFRGRVSAWVGGKRWHGAVASIPRTEHAELVLELGSYIPPHTFVLFPG